MGETQKKQQYQLEHGWLKSVMIFLHARWYLSGFTGQEYSLSNDWLGQVELRMRDIMWGLWFRVWSCSIFEVWSWQHGVVLIATCMKQLRCYDISLRPQALFTRLLNVTQDLSSPLYIEKRLSSGLYHWHPCSACELSNIYEVIFAFKTVSSIAIPSPYRKRRSFLAERRLEKRSKSAFVALVGCSNVSETSHHNHFWNMLISRANQLTLVPFWDGTSRSYLMIGSIFVYLYSYIHILDICLAFYSAEIFALCSIIFQYISWFSCILLGEKRWMFFIKSWNHRGMARAKRVKPSWRGGDVSLLCLVVSLLGPVDHLSANIIIIC